MKQVDAPAPAAFGAERSCRYVGHGFLMGLAAKLLNSTKIQSWHCGLCEPAIAASTLVVRTEVVGARGGFDFFPRTTPHDARDAGLVAEHRDVVRRVRISRREVMAVVRLVNTSSPRARTPASRCCCRRSR